MRDMVKAEAPDDATLVVTFAPKSARATCRSTWRACRFSRKPITRRGRSTNPRSILRSAPGRTRSEIRGQPLHRISTGSRTGGRADLPVNRGSYNFDTVRYEFYRDRDVAFEGFTAKNYLFREEFTARIWATRYDFPGHQGRARQARDPAGRNAVGRAGMDDQYPPRPVQGPAGARSNDQCFRFRMDQQDRHVRRLRAHGLAVPEFRHGGRGRAVAGRTEAARAIPRPGA